MKRNVGRHFDGGEPLCEIVDKRNMMLRLTAYEKDLAHLKSGERVFLDDVTVEELSGALQVPITIVKSDGKSFLDAVLGRSEN